MFLPGRWLGRWRLTLDGVSMTPLGVLIVVLALGILLLGGLFDDLVRALRQLRAGAVPLDDVWFGPMGVKLTNPPGSTIGALRAAGWQRGGYETIRTKLDRDTHRRTGRPLHRNFGIPTKPTDVARSILGDH